MLRIMYKFTCTLLHCYINGGGEAAGLVPWMGGSPDASLGVYLREAFQSQANTEKHIIQQVVRH